MTSIATPRLTVTIDDGGLQRQLEAFTAALKNPRPMLAVLGRELANFLKLHFRTKDKAEPSTLGQAAGRRSHFWLQIGRSVQNPEVGESQVSVAISDPRFAQKLYGGTIRAKRVRNLAIPLIPQAYQRAPAVFERETGRNLFFLKARSGAGLLAYQDPGRKFPVAAYLLTPSVNQKPTPGALPEDKVIADRLETKATEYVDRKLKEQGL
jgi:hypothetical protein